jgi:maltooligosyltrehalose trehalohydrolase
VNSASTIEISIPHDVRMTEDVSRSQGADVVNDGVRYRTWCKHEGFVSVTIVDRKGDVLRRVPLDRQSDGYFEGFDTEGAAGDLYQYRFGDSQGWPDPASRWQPHGVHGPSVVVDPSARDWNDTGWKAPPYSELIIYELHVGTFTPEGTFRSAIARLEHIVSLGANAIEIMPIADFPGERNWGYDGVSLYAPARTYGHPDDLRALVDAAHARGLAVILDVVYNHLGPDGNYLGVFHEKYFNPRHQTPWGAGLNFEEPAVREFFAENPLYWMREFHIDGFRLDATHAIADSSPRHVLAEIAERVHAHGGFVIAEDERNEPALLRSLGEGGLGFDGCWADDFHHVVRVMLTQDREGYYEDFEGTPNELVATLEHGWLYRGQSQKNGRIRGAESIALPPEDFVYCISNHDQVGNRAFGERLNHVVDAAAYRAASALLCLVPYTPMLFMGQEWSASTPFQFFTDHKEQLGRLVTAGRRREFQNFAAFRDPKLLETIPDPQAAETFQRSKLRWGELSEPAHAGTFRLYQDFLAFRRRHPALRNRAREKWSVARLENGIIALSFRHAGELSCVVLTDLLGRHSAPDLARGKSGLKEAATWPTILYSNDQRYEGDGAAPFAQPTTIVLAPGRD